MRKKYKIAILICLFLLISLCVVYKGRHIISKKLTSIYYYVNYDKNSDIGESTYKGEVNVQKRYLSMGFDDFRESDFNMVLPLLNEYNAHATFNQIRYNKVLSLADMSKINDIETVGSELGDHTWFHCNYIYNDPLFNGQNPDDLEGDQVVFPSNSQLRDDRGDGKNSFGFELTESINCKLSDWNDYSYNWSAFNTTWGKLTDEQCQIIRDYFSIYKDTSGMLDILDKLSNKYLGTTGKSKGSWSDKKTML